MTCYKGIAAYGDAPGDLAPAIFLITAIGTISAYSFSLLGRVCSYNSARTFSDAWNKSIGSSTFWIPATCGIFDGFIGNVAYSMILADTFKSLLATIGFYTSRSVVLLGITILVLVPLTLRKSSLSAFSFLGVLGMIYTVAAMAIRYFEGAYAFPSGRFLSDISAKLQPSFGLDGAQHKLIPNVFILICRLSTAFNLHFNGPKFFNELNNNTISRFHTVVFISFGIAMLVFMGIACFGFLTFGSACSGLILNNYSANDALMGFSRLTVATSILFS